MRASEEIASSRGLADENSREAQAQTKFAISCKPNCDICPSEAGAIEVSRGLCLKLSAANAQAVNARACGPNYVMFRIDAEAIAFKSGASRMFKVANAHAVLANSWAIASSWAALPRS